MTNFRKSQIITIERSVRPQRNCKDTNFRLNGAMDSEKTMPWGMVCNNTAMQYDNKRKIISNFAQTLKRNGLRAESKERLQQKTV